MKRLALLFLLSATSIGQSTPPPITHVDACRKFASAVVQIDTDRPSHGTGFIVDPDGWIITAGHVVINPHNRVKDGMISVVLSNQKSFSAEEVLPVTVVVNIRDFAILKINSPDKLPYVELGNEDDADIGSDLTIIGFPLSAMFKYQPTPIPKFCLTGTIAATSSFPIDNQGHYLDTVYFQGVSVKGISGSPIISDKTAKVIGIVSTKLTGIGAGLDNLRNEIAAGLGRNVSLSGMEPGVAVDKIITVLDRQLANGLGSGTGAADAEVALKEAKREYERKHPKP